MAGGRIFAGIFKEPLDLSDSHSRAGVVITVAGALLLIFFLKSPFEGIPWSDRFEYSASLDYCGPYQPYVVRKSHGEICESLRSQDRSLDNRDHCFLPGCGAVCPVDLAKKKHLTTNRRE